METRNRRKRREAKTRAGPSIQALGQVVKIKRPGVTTNEQLTPSTSGIQPNKLPRNEDKPNPTPANTQDEEQKCQKEKLPLAPLCTVCYEFPVQWRHLCSPTELAPSVAQTCN